VEADPIGQIGGTNVYLYALDSPAFARDAFGTKYSAERCAALLRKIENLREKVFARLEDLANNPRGLPEKAAGDALKPSISRDGHRLLIAEDLLNLKFKTDEYNTNCNDDPGCGQPPPPGDSAFDVDLDALAKATGLSGEALLAYLIVSEGSRIVIPIRNLVPAP